MVQNNDALISGLSTGNRTKKILYNVALFCFVLSIAYFIFGIPLSQTLETQLIKSLQQNSVQASEPLSPINPLVNQYYISSVNINVKKQESTETGKGYGVVSTDPRVLAMRKFLIDYQSPMYKSAETFIIEADKTGLDWRLVAAISGVESAFGTITPSGSFNAWGWKGDPTREWSYFGTWDKGIAVVTEGLARGYGTNLTPRQIEPIYCPPCGQNPQHAWASGVTRFMNELDYYAANL
ncbi:MAG: hypothetical protein Fur003_1990 [Candidatus Dojkabacteria bacterium]